VRARAVLLATAVAAVFAAPAEAAAPWSVPQTLSAAHQFVDPVALAFAADGAGVASWTYQDGTDAHATTGADAATRAAGAAAFGTQHRLVAPHRTDRGANLLGVAPYGHSRALRVTVTYRGGDPRRAGAFRLRAAIGSTGGTRAASHVVATGPQMLRAMLGANDRGDAAVAWWERARRSRLYVALRRPGHRFRTPQLVARSGFGDVAVAVGPRGDMLVAWESRGVIRTRTLVPGGRRFGRVMRVTRSRARGADLEAGLSRRGRAIVAWGAQRRTSGGDAGPITDAAAIRRPGGKQFGVTVLERQPESLIAQPVTLTVDPSGRATFAWTGWDGAHLRVRAATADPDAPFSAAQDVSAPGEDAQAGEVAGRAGRRALTWVAGGLGDGGRIEAAYAGVGVSLFGAPEVVAEGPDARVPRIAFDPVSLRPSVVWSERPPGGAPGAPRTVARVATR
jgi:hypothetical protein